MIRPVQVRQTVDRGRLAALLEHELTRFREQHPRSHALYQEARTCLLGGVPMTWMNKWAGGFPVFGATANGASLTDIDGHTYIDFCLGDTGAMPGHAPPATVRAIADQASRGLTTMLPSTDALWVAEELRRRFGLPYWSFTTSATDANRFVLRICRQVTGRDKVLVFDHCYHGSVDEAIVTAGDDGVALAQPGSVGPPVDPALTTRCVQFNDLAALEAALADNDVACVLTEPALTNIGIVLPEPGFHAGLRALTRRYGTLLIIDETHCLSAGPGGATGAFGLEPDVVTLGKAIAGGLPIGAFGLAEPVANAVLTDEHGDYIDVGGVGGTLAGNPLQAAAARATLGDVLTDEAYPGMIDLATRYTTGIRHHIEEAGLAWSITQLGCRAEWRFCWPAPRTGAESAAAADDELDRYTHLYLLNRGVLLTPFHAMALISPAHTERDIDTAVEVFGACVAELCA